MDSVKRSQENIDVDWFEMCDEAIKSFQPDLCGLSIMFGASFEDAQSIGETIRGKYPGMIIVSGGVHVTGLAKENGTELDFNDFICINESENHFVDLIRYINGDTDCVKGVIVKNTKYLRNKDDISNVLNTPDQLDEIPIPEFSAVELADYFRYGILSAAQTVEYDTPLATMQTTRGCKARCTFCSVRNFNGFGIRQHSPERVLKEIDLLYHQHGIRHIDFVDDDFTVSKERTIKICEMLIDRKYNLTWSIGNGIRLGTLDDELLTCMADAGCTYFSLGIESGDNDILHEMKKPLTIRKLEEKAPLLDRHPRIYYRANFIVGFPGETMEQLQRTFNCAKKYSWDWSLFSYCKPLPDTELYDQLLENRDSSSSKDKHLGNNDYTFNTITGISVESLEEQQIVDMTYDQNLINNFQFNKNLHGRHVDRAITDFERVTKMAKDHAFAWNCLAIGHSKMGQKDKMKTAQIRTKEIVANSDYWKSKFKQMNFPIMSSNH